MTPASSVPFRVLVATMLCGQALAAKAPHEIGIEGSLQVEFSRADYLPKPLDDRTPLILRIEKVQAAGEGKFSYSFHYIGFEPGPYQLADYLMTPDGGEITGEAPVEVLVRSILPEDHEGALNAHFARPFPGFGGYRGALAGAAALWLAGGAAFVWHGRRRKAPPALVAEPAPPGYAERLRPLVLAAASGSLDAHGQAELERLLTGFWREKTGQSTTRMATALAALKRHPEAGELLQALERWLHRPNGGNPQEIERLLQPYAADPSAPNPEPQARPA
jgi:hypothetical protein